MSDEIALGACGRSASIAALAGALAKAQAKIAGATKDSLNPHFKSKYADLASIWDACRGPLSANEIAVLQPVSAEGPMVSVTTLLAHSSGEWIAETLVLTAVQNTPQAVGSAITYGRRYGLASMVGVAPEDDDGEASEARGASGQSYTASSAHPNAAVFDHPTAQHGGVFLMRVDKSDTKNPNVKKYLVVDSNGETYSTINQRLAALCEQLAQEDPKPEVRLKAHRSKFGHELDAVERCAAEPDEPILVADEAAF